MKTMNLGDILTDDEINRAILLRNRKDVRDQLIRPNMGRINASLGQENDADYLSFAVEYVMKKAGKWA